MTNRNHNAVLGLLLLTLSGIWTWLVISTIPAGYGEGDIGPRAFPLIFGLFLAALSVLLLAQSLRHRSDQRTRTAPDDPAGSPILWLPAALLLIEITAYGFLLEKLGFVLATPLVVLAVMGLNLRIRAPKLLLGMSIGTTLICWIIFEKALGIYLAHGSWINLG